MHGDAWTYGLAVVGGMLGGLLGAWVKRPERKRRASATPDGPNRVGTGPIMNPTPRRYLSPIIRDKNGKVLNP